MLRLPVNAARKALLRLIYRDSIVDLVHNGLKLRCHTADNATERNIVISGDRQNRAKLQALVARVPSSGVCVDIGANCGLFSLTFAQRVGPKGIVIAIEPAPSMIERLRFNIAANGFRNVSVFATAVGAETGTVTLSVVPRQHGKASLAAIVGSGLVSVAISDLLSIVRQADVERIDAMKIDIEGYEDRVILPYLKSAPSSLWPKSILMETKWSQRWREDCLQELISRGYDIAWSGDADKLLVR